MREQGGAGGGRKSQIRPEKREEERGYTAGNWASEKGESTCAFARSAGRRNAGGVLGTTEKGWQGERRRKWHEGSCGVLDSAEACGGGQRAAIKRTGVHRAYRSPEISPRGRAGVGGFMVRGSPEGGHAAPAASWQRAG